MKRCFFILILINISLTLFAQDECLSTDRIYFKTPTTVNLPLVIVNNQCVLNTLDSVVLRRGFHSRGLFKNKIYNIDIKKDSVGGGSFIYVALLDSMTLAQPNIFGVFERGGGLFKLSGDRLDSVFSITDEYGSYNICRPDCKEGLQIIEYCIEPMIKDYPAWLFYLSDHELKLVFSQFLPEEGKDDFFLNRDN